MAYRIPIEIEQEYGSDICENTKYIPGIMHLARCGSIQLKTSFELLSERDHQPIGRFHESYGFLDYSLIKDTKIESIDGYGTFNFNDRDRTVRKINQVITSDDIDPLGMFPNNKEKQKKRMAESTDALHRSLTEVLGEKKYQRCMAHPNR